MIIRPVLREICTQARHFIPQSSLLTPSANLLQFLPETSQHLHAIAMASSHEAMKEAAENHWQNKDIAEKYKIAENATFPYAQVMAKKARLDKSEDISAFDFACGTGAVTAALYEALPKEKWEKMKVFGGDVSQPMLDYLKERGQKEGWTGLSTGIVDAAVSNTNTYQ